MSDSAGRVPAGRALVLGGGGLSGIAWETGIVAGLSAVNADLAAGYQRVLILAPMADPSLEEQVAGLAGGAEAVQVQVLVPDEASVAAMGINPLDPAVRAPVARAGYAQGQAAAAGAAVFWRLPGG